MRVVADVLGEGEEVGEGDWDIWRAGLLREVSPYVWRKCGCTRMGFAMLWIPYLGNRINVVAWMAQSSGDQIRLAVGLARSLECQNSAAEESIDT